MCYYEPFQINDTLREVDEDLEKIVYYRQPKQPMDVKVNQIFSFRSQDLFKGFYNATKDMGDKAPALWLNVEAFEYLRNDPCKPLDKMGNAMGELLNRSFKKRIDRSIATQSGYVSSIVSFAWDSDFVCLTKEYNLTIAQDIRDDWERPIVNQAEFDNGQCGVLLVRGFNIVQSSTKFKVTWTNSEGKKTEETLQGLLPNPNWGKENNRSYLMGEVTLVTKWTCQDMC